MESAIIICSFAGCDRERYMREYCSAHYGALTQGRELKPLTRPGMTRVPLCSLEGCTGKRRSHGLCITHAKQRLANKPLRLRPPKLCVVADCGQKYYSRGYCKLHYAIWKSHRIDPAHYDRLYQAQQGACAICLEACTVFVGRLCVDHDHETGRIRGLLCSRCNHGIGQLRDQPGLLRRAAQYLESHEDIEPGHQPLPTRRPDLTFRSRSQ